MKFAIVAASHADHQIGTAKALAVGFGQHGIEHEILSGSTELVMRHLPEDGPVCVWGWRSGKRLREMGYDVLLMERGYVGNRFEYVSLGWNGLNGRATFPHVSDGGQRWRRHFPRPLPAWRLGAEKALILGQVPTDAACLHVDFLEWASRTARDLEALGFEVKYRVHPARPRIRPQDIALAGGASLMNDLMECGLAVTYSSNSGVDAVLAGVPTVAVDEGSMAWAVSSRTYERTFPDREGWCHRIAWCQWLPDEIAAGDAWDALRTVVPVRWAA